MTVPGKDTPYNETDSGREVKTDVNPLYEWGGVYFRSKSEIKIAEELDNKGVLFFANARGRIGRQGSPISDASGWLTDALKLTFWRFIRVSA